MNLTFNQIRWIHTAIFFFLLVCLFYPIYSAISGDINLWTWAALLTILIEGLILVYFDWQCPLTLWAESRGAETGSVADIFLPRFLADHLFSISGTVYGIAVVMVLVRWSLDRL